MDSGGDDPDKPPQGWFVDPFGIHQQRWYSQGTPTALVRDGRAEAQDPPPDRPIDEPLVRATAPPRTRSAADDLLRAGDQGLDAGLDSQFDFFGNPALPGTVGMTTAAPQMQSGRRIRSIRTDFVPVTPKRLIRVRWVTFGFAVVWALLLTALLFAATATTHSGKDGSHTQSVFSADPAGAVAFVAMLAVAIAVTGVGFVRRVRSQSVAPSRAGYVFAGILGVLGVVSLASIGLALVVLAAALAVVARPLKKPRPLPGEKVS